MHFAGLFSLVTSLALAALPCASNQQERSAHAPARTVVLTGHVSTQQGWPAQGAVVVTSRGGKAVTGADGSFRLELGLPREVASVRVTAAAAGGTGSSQVVLDPGAAECSAGSLRLLAGATCEPSWLPTFGQSPGVSFWVHALALFDDGGGPALYAAGTFLKAGGVVTNRIARWDGTSWATLGGGLDSTVNALTVFDDGSGTALYAGGSFTRAGGVSANYIARWDGSSWSALGSGMSNSVEALAVYDDGTGPALFAGGSFMTAGDVQVKRIAKWDGESWSSLRNGMGGPNPAQVSALAVFDGGSGPALIVGGAFNAAGGLSANRIAKWNGRNWSLLGSGVDAPVTALAVFDDGAGAALYAGGSFTSAGGVAASRIARWNGASWTALGSGLDSAVSTLFAGDDGSGAALYAGGDFTSAGGTAASRVARWDGSSWGSLGSGTDGDVSAFAVFDDGSGPLLHAGGEFGTAGGVAASYVARWDGADWAPLGDGLNSQVDAVTVFDDGSGEGPALVVGGRFTYSGRTALNHVAKWNGTGWVPLGSGMDASVYALTVFDDELGDGPALYAGGAFTNAGGVVTNHVARWDGASWTPLGGGLLGPGTSQSVWALTVHDDGSGPALYAGGFFTSAGGVAANHVARWNGASWSALGSGIGGSQTLVHALTSFDDGSGPELYVGGIFASAGGVSTLDIAKWNGASWSGVGGGLNNWVFTFTTFDDGGGPALYAGGYFTRADGAPVNHVARWDGASWSALGSGTDDYVKVLSVFDDGHGPALYAGGAFLSAGGAAAKRIARWDGASWTPLGGGMDGASVGALTAFDDRSGIGPALIAGGFSGSPDSGDVTLARWQGCDTLAPTLTCPPSVFALDRPSRPGEYVTFSVTAHDASDASPMVQCVPPSGSFFPRGTTLVTSTATDAAGNQTSRTFPVTVAVKVRNR